jgi:hypothetical protein
MKEREKMAPEWLWAASKWLWSGRFLKIRFRKPAQVESLERSVNIGSARRTPCSYSAPEEGNNAQLNSM